MVDISTLQRALSAHGAVEPSDTQLAIYLEELVDEANTLSSEVRSLTSDTISGEEVQRILVEIRVRGTSHLRDVLEEMTPHLEASLDRLDRPSPNH